MRNVDANKGCIRALEMRCLRRLMNISYRDKINNIEVGVELLKKLANTQNYRR